MNKTGVFFVQNKEKEVKSPMIAYKNTFIPKEKTKREPIVITYKKGSTLPQETLDWFRFHFPQNSTFDGFFQICYRGRTGFRTLWTGVQDNMDEFLSKMKILSKSDYYISANCTSTVRRQKKALFAMQNIVIDLDCHINELTNSEKKEMLEQFLFRLHEFQEYIPQPHSIVWTGRGLQLWWAIDPMHAKCLFYYNQLKKYFLHVLNILMKEYSAELHYLSIDTAASLNPVGVFRLPGTNNPTARSRVRLERTSVEVPYLMSDLESLMEEKREELHFTLSTNPKAKNKKDKKILRNPLKEDDPFLSLYVDEDISLLSSMSSFTYFRIKQMIKLRYLRNLPEGSETRNQFSLLVYSALRGSFPHEESWKRLQAFNQGFKNPMSLSELENVICSAKEKDGYRYSNKAVIEFLDLTSREQEIIGLYAKRDNITFESTSHGKERDYNKLKKEYSKNKIISLFQSGIPSKVIAERMERSLTVINRILKPYRDQVTQGILQDIRFQLDNGIQFTQIAREHPILQSLPSTTQHRYKVKALAL